jgi:polyhydroxybutyrate depolymerase
MRMLWLVMLAACHDPAGSETLVVGTAGTGGRHYEQFVPSDTPNLPLVIALHGGRGNGRQMEKFSKLDEIAAREGFVVVYPDGVGHQWNDGRAEISTGQNDVAFISALIDEMIAKHHIDPKRVYVTGISNGGMMSYRLACDLADRIVAIAPVAGNIPAIPPCNPSRAVSVLAINGTMDPLVPYDGGQVLKTRGAVLGAPVSVARFAAADGCSAPVTTDEADVDASDGSTTRRTAYACPGKLGVELLSIIGGGHTWPGGSQYLPKAFIGTVSRDFDASERIWKFFVDHTP